MNNFHNLPFNWFDVLLTVVLILGLFRGRKRGMSLEVFTLSQWLLVLFGCAFGYGPLGSFLTTVTPFSLLTCYIISYISIAAVISIIFLMIKQRLSGKVVTSESFGQSEYYLGMPAGLLRFACVLLTFLAVLNARRFTTAEIKAREAYQKDVYGSEFFPGLSTLQLDVFETSMMGPSIRKYLSILLIQQTPPGDKRPAAAPRREAGLP